MTLLGPAGLPWSCFLREKSQRAGLQALRRESEPGSMPKALLAAAQPPLPPPRGPASARPRAQGFHGKLSLGTTTRSPRYWHLLQNLGRSVGRPALARGPGTPVRGRRGRPASHPAAQPSVTAARRDMSGVLRRGPFPAPLSGCPWGRRGLRWPHSLWAAPAEVAGLQTFRFTSGPRGSLTSGGCSMCAW